MGNENAWLQVRPIKSPPSVWPEVFFRTHQAGEGEVKSGAGQGGGGAEGRGGAWDKTTREEI